MKKLSLSLAALVLMFAAPALAGQKAAKDWSQMSIPERLAWAESYGKQVCKHGMNISKDDAARKNEIGGPLAFQWAVKMNIESKCKSAPAQRASR